MRITAKFNGRCAGCGKPTKQGDEIEYIEKKAYCVGCEPFHLEAEDIAIVDQLKLAERLGYREFSWEYLFSLRGESTDESQWSDRETSERRALRPMFAGDESEG